MDGDGTYDYQVVGVRPETDDTEEFAWVTGEVHGTLKAAQEQAGRIRGRNPGERVWVERRSNVWEEVE